MELAENLHFVGFYISVRKPRPREAQELPLVAQPDGRSPSAPASAGIATLPGSCGPVFITVSIATVTGYLVNTVPMGAAVQGGTGLLPGEALAVVMAGALNSDTFDVSQAGQQVPTLAQRPAVHRLRQENNREL